MKRTSLDILAISSQGGIFYCQICGINTVRKLFFSENGTQKIFKVCTPCKVNYRKFYRGFLIDNFHPKKYNIKITRYDEFNSKSYYKNAMNNMDVYGGWDHPKKFFIYSLFKLNFESLRTFQILSRSPKKETK